MAERHFVKYTFLKVDPAWRRLPAGERAEGKREFIAACEDFGADHLLQSFSLMGTRGDCDLMLVAEAENLDRIHEFHVVLSQSGLMKWCSIPYSFLGLRKTSEYSDEQRAVPRAFRGKYLFVYSLPEIGGQLTTLYPEKWIFDVPGHPRIIARDLVAQLREQIEPFDVPIHLETTAESISDEGDGDDRVVVLHT